MSPMNCIGLGFSYYIVPYEMHVDFLRALFFCLPVIVSGHSWIEQLTVIAPNGTFIGKPGYPRGNCFRTDPSFRDSIMANLIPPNNRPSGLGILMSDRICKSSQLTKTQTNNSPRLQAAPGDAVALRYQENGHITLPQPGKLPNSGSVFVYGTSYSKEDDAILSIHNV